jgi:hypothetical protein
MINRCSRRYTMVWTNGRSYRGIGFGGIQLEILQQSVAHNRFMDGYVYLACLLILSLVRTTISAVTDFVARGVLCLA